MQVGIWLDAKPIQLLLLLYDLQPGCGLLPSFNPLGHQLDAVGVSLLDLQLSFDIVVDEFINTHFAILVMIHLLQQYSQDFLVKAVFSL